MALPPDEHEDNLDTLALGIRRTAQLLFQELIEAIDRGEASVDAIGRLLGRFNGRFRELMAEAFTRELDAAVSVEAIGELRVGEVRLSSHLYRHVRETAQFVRGLLEEHAQGVLEARMLALAIFDGYEGTDRLRARAKLPRALRTLLADGQAALEYRALVARAASGASRLRTDPLRAAYLEAVRAVERGAGRAALHRRLQVAVIEKSRYFANRIAQTELHRLHADEQARELMQTEAIEWVQYGLSPAHPATDICDLVAGVDAWGLGPGIYQKARCPRPPLHPFCRCVLSPRLDLAGMVGEERPDAAREWLAEQGDADAARVMGSKDRRDKVLDGRPWASVYFMNAPGGYGFRTVG